MISNEQDAQRRLTSPNNLLNKLGVPNTGTPVTHSKDSVTVVEHNFGGRNKGDVNLPMFMRATIGAIARSGVPANRVASEFGVAERTVKDYKKGMVDHHGENKIANPELKEQVESKTEAIHDYALQKLMSTLGLLDDEKLANLDAKDLSRVAVNMSQVAANTRPVAGNNGNVSGVSVVVYAPPPRDENRYKVIDV